MTAWRPFLIAVWFASSDAPAADLTLELRDGQGQPIADAVAFADPVEPSAPHAAPTGRTTVDQVNKEFVPRVTVVQSGTEIFFPNSDNIRHSIYSFSPAKTFTTKLYSGREAPPVTFDRSGVVVLGCNIHDQMVAWIVIVDSPWFAKSGADGIATLRGLPPGEYVVTASAPAAKLPASKLTIRVAAAPIRQVMRIDAGP